MENLKENFLKPDSKKEVSAMRDTAVNAMVNDKNAATMQEAKQKFVESLEQAKKQENNEAKAPAEKVNEQAKVKLTTLKNIKQNFSAAFSKKGQGMHY